MDEYFKRRQENMQRHHTAIFSILKLSICCPTCPFCCNNFTLGVAECSLSTVSHMVKWRIEKVHKTILVYKCVRYMLSERSHWWFWCSPIALLLYYRLLFVLREMVSDERYSLYIIVVLAPMVSKEWNNNNSNKNFKSLIIIRQNMDDDDKSIHNTHEKKKQQRRPFDPHSHYELI